MKPNLIDAEKMSTLEDYGSMMVCAMLSVASLENYEITAYKLGLLTDAEQDTSKTICWELRRLMQLYTNQFKAIAERADIDEKSILESLQAIMKKPGKKPRKTKPQSEST